MLEVREQCCDGLVRATAGGSVDASRRKMPASRRRAQGPIRRLGRSLTVHASRRKMQAGRLRSR